MMPLTILEIDKRLLLNICIDGIEYVCRGYWGQIEEYKWKWWFGEDEYSPNPALTEDTVLCRIRDFEEDGPFVDITLSKLNEATLWAIEHYTHLCPNISIQDKKIDDIDYDGLTADVILQRIVLGKVIYG